MSKVKKAIIPAAGLGTRFLPATKAMPKEMLPILDKPTIQYIVEEAVAAGIEDIIIVTGRHKRAIEDHFDHQIELEMNLERKEKHDVLEKVNFSTNLANIFYIRQKEPKGLGHAIQTAKQFIGDEPFAVLLGDDIVESDTPGIKQLVDMYDQVEDPIIGVKTVPDNEVSRYGIIEYSDEEENLYNVSKMYEKPALSETESRLAIMGRYVLTADIFDELEKGKVGAGGEIQLTDALADLSQKRSVYAYDFQGTRYDVGDKTGFVTTTLEYALKSSMKDELLDYMEEALQKHRSKVFK
ncbi:UTP--glucose-1-phosphate uridylyltransferase GalU [Salinicoccus roseus]|uniref:UTP--glucose-1-phosphate uridylyltransferase GalU n=1 Tax=Salinicoccus roseus TaxID=45670 RepID=UPI000F4F2BA2|nr:UTP--glucose-1-phosphate uridylyltransferase GalU [Salinicoccus roseus]RPE54760.1 UDP-glucose pyrophosphorylase [Salinicoccus roseus]GGA62813.1 UTP--glucose-1-phosphate uridylyltransferase [Salinicoccus roseus]